jgi:hypothetical protein
MSFAAELKPFLCDSRCEGRSVSPKPFPGAVARVVRKQPAKQSLIAQALKAQLFLLRA